MTREDYDRVVGVHLTGHFATMRWAAEYWRNQHAAGRKTPRSIVNTASGAMLGLGGLSDYSAVKAGIAAGTLAVASELEQYDVRVNCIAPIARSRLARPQTVDRLAAPEDPDAFDMFHPGNVSPLVAYLATEQCPFTGAVFHTTANEIGLYRGWSLEPSDYLQTEGRWTVEGLTREAPALLEGRGPLASQFTSIGDTFPGTH
jgi:NAD(P)-dependent dehydrogenase (short-subunit alcohol dehydrogenase family)